jgi:hypothetical protein
MNLIEEAVKYNKEKDTPEEEDKNKLKIFDFLNQIFYKRDKHPYDKKVAPAYMLSMWLSIDSSLSTIVGNINRLQFFLKDDIIYKYYYYAVPKGKRFLKWNKKTPEEKAFKKNVEKLMEEFGLSKREAIITQKQLEVLNK